MNFHAKIISLLTYVKYRKNYFVAKPFHVVRWRMSRLSKQPSSAARESRAFHMHMKWHTHSRNWNCAKVFKCKHLFELFSMKKGKKQCWSIAMCLRWVIWWRQLYVNMISLMQFSINSRDTRKRVKSSQFLSFPFDR